MKISRIETFLVPPRWLFVRVETDSGIVGWGEPVVEGRSETVRTAVEQLSELLIGEDPLRIEDHWQVMTKGSFYRGGPILSSAVAGLDQALWDIAGKSLGVPVHQLLGGHVRDRIRMYGWVGGDEPAEVADAISAQIGGGAHGGQDERERPDGGDRECRRRSTGSCSGSRPPGRCLATTATWQWTFTDASRWRTPGAWRHCLNRCIRSSSRSPSSRKTRTSSAD